MLRPISWCLVSVGLIFLSACASPTVSAGLAAPRETSAATAPAAVTAVATAPVTPLTATVQPSPARPNIVFVLTDDLDMNGLQYMPYVQQLLAARGMTFSQYFVSVSLCCPSRSTILTGQYSQNTQIYGNLLPAGGFAKFYQLGKENSTIATWLQAAGYQTALVGKYLNGYPQGAAKTYVPPGWDQWYSPTTESAYTEYNYQLNVNGSLVQFGSAPQDYGTDVYARYALTFVRQAAQNGKPFFLYAAPFAPHLPATPAPQDLNKFANAQAPRPPSFNEPNVAGQPRVISSLPLLRKRQIAKIDDIFRKRIQSLQAVDRMVAALVDELQKDGALNNTYIFFSSDNGFHLGQHRMMAGKSTGYEEDIRVPLIVRGPGIAPASFVSALTVNTDLAPTWAELANASAPNVDGRSLVGWLLGKPPAVWRNQFLTQFGNPVRADVRSATPEPTPGMFEPPDPDAEKVRRIPGFVGLRMQNYVFMLFDTGETALYDLQTDPYELRNLAASAPPALMDELRQRALAMQSCAGNVCQQQENQPAPPGLSGLALGGAQTGAQPR